MQYSLIVITYFKQFLLWENKDISQEDEDECMNGERRILRKEILLTWTLGETGVEGGIWKSLKDEDALDLCKFIEIQGDLEA